MLGPRTGGGNVLCGVQTEGCWSEQIGKSFERKFGHDLPVIITPRIICSLLIMGMKYEEQ